MVRTDTHRTNHASVHFLHKQQSIQEHTLHCFDEQTINHEVRSPLIVLPCYSLTSVKVFVKNVAPSTVTSGRCVFVIVSLLFIQCTRSSS